MPTAHSALGGGDNDDDDDDDGDDALGQIQTLKFNSGSSCPRDGAGKLGGWLANGEAG